MAQRLSDVMRTQPMRLSDIVSQRPIRLIEIDPNRQAESLIERFGKQYFNVALAAPAQAIGTKSPIGIAKTDVKALRSFEKDVKSRYEKGQPLTQQEIEEYSKPYSKWSIGGLLRINKPDWQQKLRADYQAGRLSIKEPETQEIKMKKLQAVLGAARIETAKKADISLAVSEAENWKEQGVDVVAGISGFVSQLVALKKAFPSAPPVFIWELQSQIGGSAPGVGALTYGAFAAPGKIIKGVSTAAKAGRLVSESVLLGGMSAAHQKIETGEINATEVLISAGIPLGLRAVGGAKGVLKRALKAKNPKVIKAVNKALSKQGEINVYKTTDNSRKGITEAEVMRKGERYIDKVTGKDVVLDVTASGSALAKSVDVESSNKMLTEWSKIAKEVSKEVKEPAIKALRRRQAARGTGLLRRGLGKGESAYESIKRSVFGYKDKANVPDITPPPLSEAQWEGYAKKILSLYPETSGKVQFQRTSTLKALDQLRKGKIPTNRQFELLEPLFGEKVTDNLYKELVKKRKFSGWDAPALTVQGLKSIFGLDIQVSRQASTSRWRHPIMFKKAQYSNIRAYISKKYADKAMKELVSSPGYMESAESGINYVGSKGYSSKRLEYFRMGFSELLANSKIKPLKAYGKFLQASERGATVGINKMMKGLWDKGMRDLAQIPNLTAAQREKWILNRAKTINTNMKILRSKNPKAQMLQNAANYVLFSPSVTVSRPLSIKALLANKGSRGYQAQVLASNIGGIFLTTSIPAIIAQHQLRQKPEEEPTMSGELNPLSSLWGKIRWGDEVFDFSGGDAPFYRTIARIGVSAYLKGQEALTGKQQTTVGGVTVPSIGETLMRYGETRETALLGLVKTLATGKDFVGNDMPGYQALLKAVSPEVITATVEAGLADGTWAALATGIATANSIGVSTYPVKAASKRSTFRNIIAQKEYNKRWDNLTLKEQRKLLTNYRKQFSLMDKKVKAERVEKPYSPEKIIEEERKSRIRITKMLSKDNRSKVRGVSVAVSRRPKNFFLNDERYQKYQENVAKHLDERLTKMKLEGKSDKVRTKMLEVAVRMAKNKAYYDLRRKMR